MTKRVFLNSIEVKAENFNTLTIKNCVVDKILASVAERANSANKKGETMEDIETTNLSESEVVVVA
jgi:hypothetical protein